MKVRDIAVVRCGDKSDNGHFAILANDNAAMEHLAGVLDDDLMRRVAGSTSDRPVERYPMPNIGGLVIVVPDVLDGGAGYGWAFERRFFLAEQVMELEIPPLPAA